MTADSLPRKNVLAALLGEKDGKAGLQFASSPVPEPAQPVRKRARLWDIDPRYLRQIVGHCLPPEMLTAIARAHFCNVDPANGYAMHIEAIGFAATRNAVSEAMQERLDRLHAAALRRYEAARDTAAILALWDEDSAHGEIAGPLWAAMTHKAITASGQYELNARMHILSHHLVAADAAQRRALAELEARCAHLAAANDTLKAQHARDLARLRQQLQKASIENRRLAAVERENAILAARLERLEQAHAESTLEAEIANLKSANEVLTLSAKRTWALEKSLRAAHEELDRMARERNDAIAERDALQRVLAASGNEADPSASCAGDCADCSNACQERCILFVGGRISLLPHYRTLADRLGIRLVHHDGGLEESLSRLPEMIGQVDAVVCPTDCVSHNAYHQVKRHCKQAGKPCLLYRGAGLSGFAAALARLSAGEATLAASDVNLA